MSREARINRTIRRALERQMEKHAPPKKSFWGKRATKVVGVLVATVGFVASLATFLPRVSPTISDPADLDDPFSAAVTITNTGYIPLHAVMPSLGIGQLVTTHSPPFDPNFRPTYWPHVRRTQWNPQDLPIDERFTFALNDLYDLAEKGTLDHADVAIVVDYELPLIHIHREKIFPIIARKQTNGKFYWYAKYGNFY